jgi:glucosyl-3-phosphoglycerate phosphatase
MVLALHGLPDGVVQFRFMTAVYFIRHGQSEFNRIWAATGRDPLLRDAALSDLGHAQVEAAVPIANALRPDVVISSPLTRALQTTTGLFGRGDNVAIEVSALQAERITNTDDVGSTPKQLAERYPWFDFSHLDDPWWPVGPPDELGVPLESNESFDKRVAGFRLMIAARSEARIVVVGHGNFFAALLGRHLDNCEVAQYSS